jgi:hypothetical protein
MHYLGNVWEWVQGGTPDKRILRGGSFIDSIDGSFNHAVVVSTRQENSGDSAATNIGFRCVRSATNENKSDNKKESVKNRYSTSKATKGIEEEHIEL